MLHSFLVDVARIHFNERVPADVLDDMLSRLSSLTVAFGPRALLYVDQEAFMSLCLDTREASLSRAAHGSAEAQVAWAFESGTSTDRFRASLNRFSQWQEKRQVALSAAALREAKASTAECTFSPKLSVVRAASCMCAFPMCDTLALLVRLRVEAAWPANSERFCAAAW